MTMELVANEHDVYFCKGCENTYQYAGPKEGFRFYPSNYSTDFDDDGDFFIEGTMKVLVGTPYKACHNDESVCCIDDDDWTSIHCEMWQCECGAVYSFDNDCCGVHDYSSDEDAKRAATRCTCGANTEKENTKQAEDRTTVETIKASEFKKRPEIGDLMKVTIDRPEGARWDIGTIIKITEVGMDRGDGSCVLRGRDVNNSDSEWNLYSTSCEPYDGQGPSPVELADKFRPKRGEKKVTVIEF